MKSIINREKYLTGLVYGIIPELIIFIIVGIVWFIASRPISDFPVDLITFGYGGLMLTIAGCIGPGRYQKKYDILIYQPESGSSFSEEIPVSGFVMDSTIEKADIVVNGHKVDELVFDDSGIGKTTIHRSDFINSTINKISLEQNDVQSNSTDFTLFEYTEDMTEEEIDVLFEMENTEPVKEIEEAKQNYAERINSGISSITLGVFTLGILNLLFAVIRDYLLVYIP